MDNAITTEQLASIGRLYLTFFNRMPEKGGLNFWIKEFLENTPLNEIAKSFSVSDEFKSTYGQLSEPQFVNLLYQNVLNRSPDDEGYAYWQKQMASGMKMHEVALRFSESTEQKNQTSEFFDEFTMEDGNYIYDTIPGKLPDPIEGSSPDILNLTYDQHSLGEYTKQDLERDVTLDGFEADAINVDGEAHIVSDGDGAALSVTYNAEEKKNGIQFYVYNEANPLLEVLYFTYQFTLGDNFDIGKGMKFPGAGGNAPDWQQTHINPTGGRAVGPGDGFTYRVMVNEPNEDGLGKAEQYIYNQHGIEQHINFKAYGFPVYLERGKTYQIDQKIVMNAPGESNGRVTTWLNGIEVFNENNVVLSENGTYGANKIFFDSWHGGDDNSWGPKTNVQATFDNVKASTSPITAGLVDPNESDTVNTSAITALNVEEPQEVRDIPAESVEQLQDFLTTSDTTPAEDTIDIIATSAYIDLV